MTVLVQLLQLQNFNFFLTGGALHRGLFFLIVYNYKIVLKAIVITIIIQMTPIIVLKYIDIK